MSALVEIDVAGVPAPQGSKRHVGNGVMLESSKKVKPWRAAVAAEAERQSFEAWPFVTVAVWFRLKRPKSHYRTGRYAHLLKDTAPAFPARYPDLDKLCRSTLDALRMGGAFKDDAQVVKLHAYKVYAGQGEEPGALIRVASAL
ncbi:RusA family crossover junction endodeoxyribonuclease [Streptomyces antimicrobicus]|uniref:RusA family crossover junction endodeoxyribonuclease n=1 Tax=Streptomyces antimicrobicus TaxID=2883108 RepID=A0ABS8B4P2_9ACTN|nr:RusA family crossover junction endodeoxyribonuclease [Streptomyces antimicrobicus]MCB5179538.1 RusA family crossover junction endodeoxyribonuclease [Streptomyces antimicrobicus]